MKRSCFNVFVNIYCQYIRKYINTERSNKNRRRINKNWSNFLMASHPLTDFKIQRYYLDEPKFNSVYLKNNSSEIKDGEYIINIDEY